MIRTFNTEKIPAPHINTKPSIDLNLINKLSIEIGCGVGLHPIQFSKEHSAITLFAIEHTSEKFKKMQRRISNQKVALPNLFAIHANAISWITHFVPNNSVHQYFLLYPKPNFKNKSQRWFCMPFMEKLIQTMRNEATLFLATNEKEYADEAEDLTRNHWCKNGLVLHEKRMIHFEQLETNYKPLTHFEKKYLLAKQNCYHLIFRNQI